MSVFKKELQNACDGVTALLYILSIYSLISEQQNVFFHSFAKPHITSVAIKEQLSKKNVHVEANVKVCTSE